MDKLDKWTNFWPSGVNLLSLLYSIYDVASSQKKKKKEEERRRKNKFFLRESAKRERERARRERERVI